MFKISFIHLNESKTVNNTAICNPMTKSFIIIASLSTLLLCSCGSDQVPDLTEDEVYTILNEIVKTDSLIVTAVCWKFQTIELTDEMKKEFTIEDLYFIARQQKLFKNSTIKPNKLKWYHWRKKKYVNMKLDTSCNEGLVYNFSFPIVSADRKKVIIEIESDCNCFLGGSGGKDLYEKKNGRWVKTNGFDHWISQNQIAPSSIN